MTETARATLRTLPLRSQYRTNPLDGGAVVREFYVPVLSCARRYDRLSGFFSSASLSLAARGVAALIANGGHMRLVCSPNLSAGDARVLLGASSGGAADDRLSRYWNAHFAPRADEIARDHLAALGWMLKNGFLEIRLAVVEDADRAAGDNRLCHPKIGLVEDFDGDTLSFSGSNNETAGGWVGNQEEFKVFKGWEAGGGVYLREDRICFDLYWEGRQAGVRSYGLPDAFAKGLIQESAHFDKERYLARHYTKEIRRREVEDRLSLRPYQKDAIRQWEENSHRLLFEMATGSGKTRTAIGCVNRMMEAEETGCVVVAAPRIALCDQWRREMAGCLVSPVREITANSEHAGWRDELAECLSRFALGTARTRFAVVYTSHATAANGDFVELMRYAEGKMAVMLVADEAHGLGAEQLRKALSPGMKYRVGLSATPARLFDEEGTRKIVDYFGGESFVFTIGEALKAGFLCPYDYHPVLVALTDFEQCRYDELTERIRKLLLVYENTPDPDVHRRLTAAMRARARVVAAASGKLPALRRLLRAKKNEMDAYAIAFACDENIQKVIGAYEETGLLPCRYTSRESVGERAKLLRLFADGGCAALVAIKCLDEGIDIPAARHALLISSTVNPREYIQRIGRVIRKAPGKSKADIYDFLVTDAVTGKIMERDFRRGAYVAQYADNATGALNVLYRQNKTEKGRNDE